jgi:GntR family transcriptional regulator, histidine utilization repressor
MPPRSQPSNAKAMSPYARVKLHLKDALARGRWAPGERMPSEAALVAQFNVSRMTINRALRELQDDGLVTRSQGQGTFAAQPLRLSSTLTIRDLHEEIESRGHHHHLAVHLLREERATLGLAAQLGLKTGAPVFHSIMVHFEQGMPLQCEDRFVNPACAADYLNVDFQTTTATQYLLKIAPLTQAQFNVEAGYPTVQEATMLAIDSTAPCLIVVRRTESRGVPASLARLVHPGTRYQVEARFPS